MSVAGTLADVRSALVEYGYPAPVLPGPVRDQAWAGFRADLVSLGIDPADRTLMESVLAGMVIGVKVLIQQGTPLPLVAHYVTICEVMLPLLDEDAVNLSDLPDMDFLSSLSWPVPDPAPDQLEVESEQLCSQCQAEPAVMEMPSGLVLGLNCARKAVIGGMQMLRISGGFERPTMGGPGFNRGPDPEPAEPEHVKFWDRTLSDLLASRIRKRR